MKQFNPKHIYLLIIAVLVSIILLRGCKSEPIIIDSKPNHDTIYVKETIQAEIFNKLKAKNDSLLSLKPKHVHHYHNTFDSLYFADTLCQKSLTILYNEFGKLNSLNDSIIKNDSLAKVTLINIIDLKQAHITIDSTYIATVPTLLKKAKRKGYFKGVRHGVVVGGVIAGGVCVGVKF